MKNWTTIRNVLFCSLVALLVGNGIACNTFKGAGKDVEKGGEKMQDVADDAKH